MSEDPVAVLAVRALFHAAIELPLDACQELARRITEFVLLQVASGAVVGTPGDTDTADLLALREVADEVGHPPSTTEYMGIYRRRRDSGEDRIPPPSSIVKRWGGWERAKAEAGLIPADVTVAARGKTPPSKRIFRYDDQHLIDALRACADDIGHSPSVREYCRWRDARLGGLPNRRAVRHDIPHFRTIEDRWGCWLNAIEKAFPSPIRPGESPRLRVL